MALDVQKKYDEKKDAWVVNPKGDIDIFSSPKFKEELLKVVEEGKDVIIDGTYLEYIDSTGLGVLISGLKRIKDHNKKIILREIKPNVEKLFKITGLDEVFHMGV